MNLRRPLFALALLLLSGCGGDVSQGQGGVVSLTPCSDAVLEALGADQQIRAISPWSRDASARSGSAVWAARFPATSGRGEDLVHMAPELVLSGGPMSVQLRVLLDKAGIKHADFPIPSSIDESLYQVRSVANAIGMHAQGIALAKGIEQQIDAAAQSSGGGGRTALILSRGGLVPGDGTLADDMLRRMGYVNAAQEYGLKQWDIIRLETLLADPPDVIFASIDASSGDRLLRHPAMAALHGHTQIRAFPPRLLFCGGPTMADMALAMRNGEEQ